MAQARQTRLSAVLMADIVGYTSLMERDSDGTVSAWQSARSNVVEPQMAAYRGEIVKYTGDGFLAEFSSVQNALECALTMQSAFDESPLKFRMAVNLGDVIHDGVDIHGEGVNIAARMEGLAEPGDICVTAIVRDSLRNRVPVTFDALGLQTLKNVSEPVAVYRVVRDHWAAPERGSPRSVEEVADEDVAQVVEAAEPRDEQATSLMQRPAVAILPFDNMSGDQEQEYFADGITEDIITELAKASWFPVIARNSTFAYKGQSPDVRKVANELGAAYVVEGSVRKGGNRVRITAQLIDASNGQHIWAERYDRELTDVFEVQDEITMSLAGAIMPELYVEQQKVALRKPPGSLAAWDLMLKAQWNHAQFKAESFAEARQVLFEALRLDPDIPMVHALISDIDLWGLSMGWRQDVEEALAEAAKHASTALNLDPGNAHARACMSWVELFSGDPQKAREAADEAIRANPSYAVIRVYCGNMYVILGEADLALEQYNVMRRLSPRDPLLFVADSWTALGHYVLENYEEAVEWCRRSQRQNDGFIYTLVTLLAAYGQLGQQDEARSCLQRLLELVPETSEQFVRQCYPFPDDALIERFLDGLNKAGVPL